MEKTLIAMSGGVDSSVAAYLMQRSGYDCVGTTMRLWAQSDDNVRDAEKVASRLGMPFFAMDATAQFREKVVDSFIRTYEAGDTPNPCITCNKHNTFSTY